VAEDNGLPTCLAMVYIAGVWLSQQFIQTALKYFAADLLNRYCQP